MTVHRFASHGPGLACGALVKELGLWPILRIWAQWMDLVIGAIREALKTSFANLSALASS